MPSSHRLTWLVLILLAACRKNVADPSSETAVVTAAPVPDVVVVGKSEEYPEGCHPRQVADRVLSFIAAYNAGDMIGLDQAFAGYVEWYSDTKEDVIRDGEQVRSHFVTYERDGIFPYFALRHAQQDKLKLIWLNVIPKTWHGGVDISFALRRRAEDLGSGLKGAPRFGVGKGALRCPERKIFVWSMAVWRAGMSGEEGVFLAPSCMEGPAPDDLAYVIDPGNGRFLSHIFAVDAHQPRLAFTLETRTLPEATLSHDGRFLYVADSYLSRVTCGEQHDVYSVYDARSGALLQANLPLPDRLRYKLAPAIDRPNSFSLQTIQGYSLAATAIRR